MLDCYLSEGKSNLISIKVFTENEYSDWLKQQKDVVRNWLNAIHFRFEPNSARLIPNEQGNIALAICCVTDPTNLFCVGNLPTILPEGNYRFEVDDALYVSYAIAWGMGAYQFTKYKKQTRIPAKLYLPKSILNNVLNIVESIYLVRDLINTPTEDLGPSEFAKIAEQVAKEFNAKFSQIVGDDLLKQNYPGIHTVGRASDDAPRLLDIRWGDSKHPRITIVGKGVCFDSGGLNIKPAAYMLLMKKDMGGAANALGLARMIMAAKLPICLRVLLPVVENVISGNAYRPGDVIKSRKGLTIEVGNTDAEGRVVVADAITDAVSEKPALLIDITTLTGAARIALGPDLPVVFSNNDDVVNELIALGNKEHDPMWRLPLYAPYKEFNKSAIADINNAAEEPLGGAITAALFLQAFVPDDIPWVHFDMMAWSQKSRPGHPVGGEAMCIRTLFHYLSDKYK